MNFIPDILIFLESFEEIILVKFTVMVLEGNKSSNKSPHSIIVTLFLDVKYSSPPIFKKKGIKGGIISSEKVIRKINCQFSVKNLLI